MAEQSGSGVGKVWALIAGLAGAAGLIQLFVLGQPPTGSTGSSTAFAVLVAGFVMAELCVVHITVRQEAVSFALAEIPWVLGLFTVSATRLVVARVAGGAIVLAWHRRQSLLKLSFNLSQLWLGAVAATACWQLALGSAHPQSVRGWLAAVASAAMIELVGALAISAVLALRGDGAGSLPLALGTGLAAAASNACFGLIAMSVMRSNWRGLWALVVVALFFALAQRAHMRLLRRHDAMERLHAFTRQVGSSDLNVDTVVAAIVMGLRDLLEVDHVTLQLDDVGVWTGDANGLRAVVEDEEQETQGRVRRSRGSVERLTTPLLRDGQSIGSLTAAGRQGAVGGLERSDVALLEAAAGHAVVGLHNARLADELRGQARANEHQALHDHLTDLPNRLLFDKIATCALETHNECAVLLLDLDRFKEVNDTLGHAAGDAVLREVASRLQQLLDGSACVARLGGDEFAVVIADADEAMARMWAGRISSTLSVPLAVLGVTLALDASIGIALTTSAATDDVDDLLRQADVAMYSAKGSHSRIEVYAPDRDHNSAARLSLAADLRAAIENGELLCVYQPQLRAADSQVAGFEALVRWESPSRGLVSPDQFIGVAEQTGLIAPLTDYVLGAALQQLRSWMDEGFATTMSVNISPRSLHDPALATRVAGQLADAGVPPGRLTLEITEDALMVDPERAIDVLWQLRRLGVHLSVDDLGTGQASLAYLKRLPVHEVKIDRSFVTHLLDDPSDHAIVQALVPLVHQLEMTVVAEGVEDERTWQRLVELGADSGQGYWICRPQRGPQATEWLRAAAARTATRDVIPMPRRAVAHH